MYGKIAASNAPYLIYRRTVVESTRRPSATSDTVNKAIFFSYLPYPFFFLKAISIGLWKSEHGTRLLTPNDREV
jgi:hypothetical protein